MNPKFFTKDLASLTWRLIIADGHRCVAEGISGILLPHVKSVDIAHDGSSLVEKVMVGPVDLVISDIAMPILSGLDALRRIRELGSSVPFLVLSAMDDPKMVREAMRLGSSGYVVKQSSCEELYAAILAVMGGKLYVTPRLVIETIDVGVPVHQLSRRQRQVIDHLAGGLRTVEIAELLHISPRTVENHRQALLDMFGVHNSISLLREAERQGVIRPIATRPVEDSHMARSCGMKEPKNSLFGRVASARTWE
ncbi:response regulator transcription factor [Dyella japonica]|uniref:DNA-binding NarL/FixJ family response regulator n=1 Tax=Dyella japonica TaxID=231455 RepID=A0ABV2K165_9GAMM